MKIVFIATFLVSTGFSLQTVLALWVMYALIRSSIRFLSIKLLFCFPVTLLLSIGVLLNASAYILLYFLGVSWWFSVLYFIAIACIDSLYWTGFHTLYSLSGNNEHRGKQVAVLFALNMIVQAGLPLLFAFLSPMFGGMVVPIVCGITTILSLIPLSFVHSSFTIPRAPILSTLKTYPAWFFVWSMSNAWYNFGYSLIWTAIIYSIAGDMKTTGILLGLSIIVQVILQIIFGSFIDKGYGKAMVYSGNTLTFFQILFQMLFVSTGLGVFISNFFGFGKWLLAFPSGDAVYYNTVKHASSPALMVFWGELGYDTGALLGLSTAVGILGLGVDERYLLIIGVGSTIINTLSMRSYFLTETKNHTPASTTLTNTQA